MLLLLTMILIMMMMMLMMILYNDYESSFEALPSRNGSNSIHDNNLQKLMIEPLNP